MDMKDCEGHEIHRGHPARWEPDGKPEKFRASRIQTPGLIPYLEAQLRRSSFTPPLSGHKPVEAFINVEIQADYKLDAPRLLIGKNVKVNLSTVRDRRPFLRPRQWIVRACRLHDPAARAASVQVWYRVGSGHETRRLFGAAHLLKTSGLLRGTAHIGPEEHMRIIQRAGGQANAFTTEEVTVLHQSLPVDSVGLALELEADRMEGGILGPGARGV